MSNHTRRTFLYGLGASALMARVAHAGLPLDGWKEAQIKPQQFQNFVLLGADGQKKTGWGLEILPTGTLRCGPQIKGGTDLRGAWISPTFIDAGCTLGMFEIGAEDSTHDHNTKAPESPNAFACDGYNPLSKVIPTSRANGIATAVVHPSLQGLIPGHAVAVQTLGMHRADAILTKPVQGLTSAGLYICLGNAGKSGQFSSRMEMAAKLREIMKNHSASPPVKKCRLFCKKAKNPYAGLSEEEKVWKLVRDRKLPVLVKAERVDDIVFAVNWIKQNKLRGVLVGAAEGWLVAKQIAQANIPVLLGPPTVQPSSFEKLQATEKNAMRLFAAGVTFAFRSGSNHFARTLPSQVAVAVAHGLPYEAAIAAFCLHANTILGLGMRPLMAQENQEFDGRFCISNGDPLQVKTDIQRMWIAGREVDLRTKQTELYRQYRRL